MRQHNAMRMVSASMIAEDGLTPRERAAIIDEREYEEKRRQDWEDALQKGMEQGEKHNALNTARKMLAKGYAPHEITELTGLTSADITDLQQQTAEGKPEST